MEEIELTFIDIDKEQLEEKLRTLGAKKMGEYHYRRIVFDYPDFRLDKDSAWVRLRDEGDVCTLTFKKRLGQDLRDKLDGDDGMYECETIVGDFEATREILLKMGLVEKMYQENKRTRYVLSGVECDIDTWPLLDPYLEIEGESWEEVHVTALKLGLNPEDGLKCTANQIYRRKGIDDRDYAKLTFEEQVLREEKVT